MSQTTYLNIISGRAPELVGVPARLALTVLSWPYSAIVRMRNRLYSAGWLKVHTVNVPVLCVGNLTTGGTGKTPLVVWLCRLLRERQVRCAILTRGYKMPEGELSDEPALLSAQCPGIAVIINPDRVAGAAVAIRRGEGFQPLYLNGTAGTAAPRKGETPSPQVLVMDDGFQHRRLARDLDIVAIDATQPFGYSSMGVPPMYSGSRARCPCYGRVLPAGLLREPVAGLRRAHAVVLTRCDQVPQDLLGQIEEDIRRVNHDLVIARSVHVPVGIRTHEGAEISFEQIRGKRLFAFCGIGNPQSFFHTVERLGGLLAGSRAYDDHYRYDASDLDRIHHEAARQEAQIVLTTQKDWMRIARWAAAPGHPPLAYLAVELQITAGAQELIALIDRVLGGRIPNP